MRSVLEATRLFHRQILVQQLHRHKMYLQVLGRWNGLAGSLCLYVMEKANTSVVFQLVSVFNALKAV